MSNPPGGGSDAEALGVVDPIRLPLPAALPRAWRRLPALGKAFVVLAALDVLVRALGLFGTSLAVDVAVPVSFVTAFAPHSLLILLPAILLFRRTDAQVTTPLVFRGAMVVAVLELVREPIQGLTADVNPEGAIASSGILYAVATLAIAAGWLAIGIGLAALNPARPGPSIAGLANLVSGAIVAGAVVGLASLFILPTMEGGDPGLNSALAAGAVAFAVQTIVWAFVARAAIRGTGDSRRPLVATYTATGAFILIGIGGALGALVGVFAIVQYSFELGIGAPEWALALGWAGGGLATSLVVVAFALGLADAPLAPVSGRMPSPDGPPLAWPSIAPEDAP